VRRADRLFEIIQIMRQRKLVRAQDLAETLEVSERTVYRDIRDLVSTGVPIEGAAGVGYVLRNGFDLPPLMFNENEIEALVLEARIVGTRTDRDLARAAVSALAKIETVLPERLRRHMADTALHTGQSQLSDIEAENLTALRDALRDRHMVQLDYRDATDVATARWVRPLGLFFFGPVWLLAAWCELRGDFRSFRLDRIASIGVDPARRFDAEPGRTLQDFLDADEA